MEIIKRNWKIKILSLFLAILLWSYVMSTTNPTVDVSLSNIPIVYENVEDLISNDLIMDPNTQKTVNLTISGQRSLIVNITAQHIRVSANMANLDEGVHTVPLSYSLPDGIVLEQYANDINVNIDKVISREMKVEVNGTGSMQENFVVETANINPERVSIRGARTNLDKVDKLVVDLDLNTLTSNTTANKEIRAIDSEGKDVAGVTLGQDFANLSVIVNLQKEVPVKPVVVGELNDNYKLSDLALNRSTAFIEGPAQVIENIEKIQTQEVNISGMTQSETVPVKLDLETDVRLVNPEVDYKLEINIQGKTDKAFSVPIEKLQVKNAAEKTYVIDAEHVQVVLNGFSSELHEIDLEDLTLELDLSTLNTGSNIVSPVVYINGKVANEGLVKSVENIRVEKVK